VLMTSLAWSGAHALRGGTKADNPHRRLLGAAHGIAAILIPLGGFGMLARLGIVQGGLPGWIYVKLLIWLVLAAAIVIPHRRPQYTRALLVTLPFLALAAAATALLKPL